MSRKHQWGILGAVAGVYLIGLGLLAGIMSERFRFDGVRAAIVRQFDEATRRARAHAMSWEQEVQRVPPPAASPRTEVAPSSTWATYLEVIDAALVQRDVSTAERAWREAYAAAVRTRAWRPLIEVGDAAVRIGAADGRRNTYVTRAREVYLAALVRARADRSVDGVVNVAEAFYALGDHQVVEQCLDVAERLGAGADSEAVARLRALTRRALDVHAAPRIEP